MKDFFQQFLINSELNQAPNDILQALSKFRISVTPEVCKKLSQKQIIEYFENVFYRLFNCSESESASIRVSTFPALISFLSKMIRTYSDEIQISFIHFATKQTIPSKGSIIVVSIFAYICNFIAKPFLEKFINSVPYFHHFTMCLCNPDQLSHVITWLPVFDANELMAILMTFLNQYKSSHDIQLFNPIKNIVEKNEELTIPEIIKSGEMPLIAYLFTALKIKGEKFDLNEIAHQALQKLKTAEFSEIEDCFQILSIQTSKFQTKVKLLNEDEISISISDESSKEKEDSIVLKISDYINKHPYFYSLKLPNSILFPQDGESSSIISIKFQTISLILSDPNEIIDVEEYLNVYDKFCCNSNVNDCVKNEKMSFVFNEVVSSALRSFASSLPCLIANATDFKLVRIIKFILNAKIKSWIHGIDVLYVIEALGDKLIEFIPLKQRILLLLSLSMNKNEILSEKAIEIIVKLTNPLNFVEVTDLIAKDIDFFSHFSIQKHLRALSKLIRNPSLTSLNKKHFQWIHPIILAVENDYLTDLYTLSEILNFMQFLSNLSMKRLIDISYTILIYSILHLKGKDFTNTISADLAFYGEKVDNYLNKKMIDITNKHPYNFVENFPLIHNAFTFYLRQQKEKKSQLFMIEHFFDYFPLDSTITLNKIEDKVILNKLSNKLKIVTDIKAISLWCKMMPKNDNLVVYAKYYLAHSYLLNSNEFYNFITFLDTFDHLYEAMIIVSILDMDKQIALNVVLQCLDNHNFSSKYSKQLNSFTASFYKTEFSMKSNEEKLEIVKSIIHKDKKLIQMQQQEALRFNKSEGKMQEIDELIKLHQNKNYLRERKDIIDFALMNLNGWNKIIFEELIGNKNSYPDLKPRAFICNDCIHLKTRVADDVESQFIYFVDTYQIDRIKFVLSLSIIHNQIINLNKLSESHKIPENVQQMVMKFYSKRKISLPENKLDVNNQISSLLSSDDSEFHVAKSQLKNIYYSRKAIKNSINVFKLFEKIFQNYQYNNIHVALIVLCSMIKRYAAANIPTDFVEFYFGFVKRLKGENAEIIQLYLNEIAYSIFLLSRKVKFSYEQNQIVRSLFGICQLSSVAVSYLLSIMIHVENSNIDSKNQVNPGKDSQKQANSDKDSQNQTSPSKDSQNQTSPNKDSQKQANPNKFVFGNLIEIIQNLIENEIPSLFISGIRILRQVHSLQNISQISEIVEPFFFQIFNRIKESQFNEPIEFFTKMFLLNLLSIRKTSIETDTSDSKKIFLIQLIVLNHIASLVNESDEFLTLVCPSISCCVQNMKQYSSLTESKDEIVIKPDKNGQTILNLNVPESFTMKLKSGQQVLSDLHSLSDNLIVSKGQLISPVNVQRIVTYVRAQHFRAKGIESKTKREVYLMNCVMKYMQSLRSFDSYKIIDVYNEWIAVIKNDLSFENAIKVLVHKFMMNATRFFPVFTVLAKEVKKVDSLKLKEKDDNNDLKCINSQLNGAVKVIHDEMHVMALQGLKERKPYQEILDIASLENYA